MDKSKIFFILLFVGLAYSCKVVTVDKKNFTIELDKDGVGGYTWNYLPGNTDVKLIDSTDIPKTDSTGFTEYSKQYKFQASRKGLYKLEFLKKRSFSKTADTAETYKKYWIRVK
ncbi:protease inhibitor I42 family protein [Gramella sp. KN1008]|uniref:protease inhibitor I42 family protein n=1 Tax=Gramella sp. KN1008 TaxID=2529298 RepID=UPI00103E6D53|nr:protease inhibitor I42 family protein [Gramella sp. KN1008]TBW28257.1 hypothetical protein EZJ28_05790 [Gramella sp. KN1008]